MDITLRDAARGVTEEGTDDQLREAEFTCHGTERVAQHMWREIANLCFDGEPLQNGVLVTTVQKVPLSNCLKSLI